MPTHDLTIRPASPADAEALLDIYAPYVRDTAVTFEYDVPSLAEFRRRIETTLVRHPWLVAEQTGVICGYAYAGPFKGRAAYDWSVETSVYVRRDLRGGGVGSALYRELERISQAQGIVNLYACIACTDAEDDRLTNASIAFHERRGYRLAGAFPHCAYKFDRWYDMVWMSKQLTPLPETPKPLVPYSHGSFQENADSFNQL
ncbi:GNAT family N-acetyltransferase [Eggerthellaceae bacterium zg-887]|uniref:GNAT family N-acetyltransferase n=1 Tax=Xiamenia xianingshaonis TaxID=2682776 RepID=UPI00140B1F8E|nr:GNAT family N-acetyltransferase [Xiamenia xianingshaonis]NHM16609.1 GNAT family N-acetyltransferase [Xiamenia xianingshaonis]